MIAEDFTLQKNFRYLEWLIIAMTALTQLAWVTYAIKFHWLIAASFVLLVGALALSLLTPRSARWRFVLLLAETAVVSAACALGQPRRFTIYFLVLAAKAAALLPRTQTLWVVVVLLIARLVAGASAEYVLHHIYVHRHFVPHF